MKETQKEREARKKRAQEQIEKMGRASLQNMYSPEKIEAAMYVSGGHPVLLARILKITLSQLYVYLEQKKERKELWEEIRRTHLGKAESVMIDLLDSKNEDTKFRAAKYLLDKRGKDLGYGDSQKGQEITIKEGEVSIKQIFGIQENE